ncbi:MAG: T9SS type A sorting domain-containing protein [Bacteroidia bacterium]
MKNRLLHIIMLLFLCNGAFAQAPLVKQWDKRFGGFNDDAFTTFQQTSDGGYILGGASKSGISGDKTQPNWDSTLHLSDYWVVKIDSIGNKQWDKRFGGTASDYLTSLQETTDGGFILGGMSNSDSNGDKTQPVWNNYGFNDYWIVKIDSLGNKQWDKRFGGTFDDRLFSVLQTTDGGYVLGGFSISPMSGDKTQPAMGYDYWIVKTDSLGMKQWDKSFGGADGDYFNALRQTVDGGYILGGYSYSGISGDKTQSSNGWDDYWIVKIDSTGTKQWDKGFGGTASDDLNSITQTTDKGYILGGFSSSPISGDKTQSNWDTTLTTWDYWILKIDSLGNKQWDKRYGGTFDDYRFGNISQIAGGGYLISGTSDSPISGNKTESNLGNKQIWVVRTDALGTKLWDKTIFTTGDDLWGNAIQTKDGCYAIAGETPSGIGGYVTEPNWDTSNVFTDYWIIKLCDTTQINSLPIVNLSSNDTLFCEKHCLDFFDLSTNNPTSWQWLFPGSDSLTSTLQNPTNICYNSYGSYDVTLIACNAAGCDTLNLTNFITCYQNPTDSIYQSNDTLFSLPAYAYQWYEVTNGIIAGATDQYFIPQQAGSYYCVISDSIGCNASSDIIVITAANQISNFNFPLSVIPNPFNSTITITFQKQNIRKTTFTIKNVLGQNVYSNSRICPPSGVRGSAIVNNSFQIDLSFLPKGIYLLVAMIDDTRCIKKIVKD